MNLHLLSESFQSLLLTSLGASLLTVFAVVLRHTLKKWLPVHVFYILSTLVLLRLASCVARLSREPVQLVKPHKYIDGPDLNPIRRNPF